VINSDRTACVGLGAWIDSFKKPENGGTLVAEPEKAKCSYGTIESGVYVVILNGGKGGRSTDFTASQQIAGGSLKFRFYLPQSIVNNYNKYRICHGADGTGSRRHGSGGGGGSWLEIGTGSSAENFDGKYFFVAGGGGGSGEYASDCAGGGGGGGVGAGGGGSDSPNGDCSGAGGTVGPYATVGQGCARKDPGGYGQGVKNNGTKGIGDSSRGGGGGSGGGNGGAGGAGGCASSGKEKAYAGGASGISTFDILTKTGTASTTNKVFGGKGGSHDTNGAVGSASHTSNDVTTISVGVRLYKLAAP
jgi:hypothetical protein